MRKTLGLLLLLIQFSCSKTNKPEGLILKVNFQPEKTYSITTIKGSETVITYSGEDIAMRKLKSMHVKNPTVSKVKTKTDTELVTGKRLADQSYPAILTYKKIMSLDGKTEIPEGTVVEGKIEGEELPGFSKVTASTLDFDQKIQLLNTVRSSFGQFDFPKQRLKIGDQFSTDRPGTMAITRSEINTIVTTAYKLLSIKDGMAQFEVSQSYLLTPKLMDNSFTGSGNGKGSLTYDIKNCLISDYSVKTELTINKKLDYYEFDLRTINEFTQNTSIKAQ